MKQERKNTRIVARIIRVVEKAWFSPLLHFADTQSAQRSPWAGFTNAHTAPYRKFGFTLAEVLITLGIIGVVAAMTIPMLVARHRVSVVETSLKKFYTTMNQAIGLSVAQNGETQYWEFPTANTVDSTEFFVNKYLKNYIKITSTEKLPTYYNLYFADGSGARVGVRGQDWAYCVNAKELKVEGNLEYGRSCFLFGFYPGGGCAAGTYTYKNFFNKGVEPYISCIYTDEDGNTSNTSENDLYKKPTLYTKAIQLNGWKIPKDYPIKL